MAQIIDSIVKISINEAISTVSTTSVNTLALVGPASSEAEMMKRGLRISTMLAPMRGKSTQAAAMPAALPSR